MCGMTLPAPVSQVQALVFDLRHRDRLALLGDPGRGSAGAGQRTGGGLGTLRRRLAPRRLPRGTCGGELPWMNADALHRRELDVLLPRYGIGGLDEREIERFNRVWHRLDPWPDAVPGLTRLRRKYVIALLSNGGFALLTNLSKRAGLPWDCILSAELVGAYKPDPQVYRTALASWAWSAEVMLVAAHGLDLGAGRRPADGLRLPPLEHGPGAAGEPPRTPASTSWPQTSSTWPGSWAQEARRRPAGGVPLRCRAPAGGPGGPPLPAAGRRGRASPRDRPAGRTGASTARRQACRRALGVWAHQLVPAVGDHPPVAQPGAHVGPVALRGAGEQGAQRAAVHARQRGPAGEVEEGGGEVVHRDQGVTGHAGLDPRPGQHQGTPTDG